MTASDKPRLDRAHVLSLLRDMIRIRKFEDKCAELYTLEKIRGFLHLYDGEEAIAAGVIPMPVGIDQKTRRRTRHCAQGAGNLVGHFRVLIINNKGAILADGNTDVATLAHQHIQAISNRYGLYLHRVPVVTRQRGTRRKHREDQDGQRQMFYDSVCHDYSP